MMSLFIVMSELNMRVVWNELRYSGLVNRCVKFVKLMNLFDVLNVFCICVDCYSVMLVGYRKNMVVIVSCGVISRYGIGFVLKWEWDCIVDIWLGEMERKLYCWMVCVYV